MPSIVVTGGAGFIGSNVCAHYFDNGYEVYSIDNYLSGSKENHVSGVKYYDSCCSEISNVLADINPCFVFHFGEYSRAEQSYKEPHKAICNITATLPYVLEYARNKKSKLIYAGSSTKFSNANSPYIMAKRLNSEHVKQYCEMFNLDYAIAYFHNVYGDNDIAEGQYATVIPKFVKQAKAGETLKIHGNGSALRYFTHISDALDAIWLIAKKGYGDDYQIASDKAYTVLEIAKALKANYEFVPDVKGNRKTSVMDNRKTKSLDWFPRIELMEYLYHNG
jgi:UDP-glucose 4-epimerase